jgi:hypothetical protein
VNYIKDDMKILALMGTFSAIGFAAASLAILALDRLLLFSTVSPSGERARFVVLRDVEMALVDAATGAEFLPSSYPILSASTFESCKHGPNLQK